jgi:hypothetical protein
MSFTEILPFFSTVIMIVFTVSVFQRYAVRRAPHFLYWGIGLAMFGIGSFAEAYLAVAWNQWIFFCWYLFGAALNAAWIGHGTLNLLARKKWVHGVTVALVVGSLFAGFLMLRTMPLLNTSAYTAGVPISEQYSQIMPPIGQGGAVRLTTPFFNIYGLITLVGGALYSAWLFWRKRVLPNRVIGNILIAAGALSIGSASALTRFGYGQLLFAGELVAAILMFWGFTLAGRPAPQPEPMAEQATVGAD